MTHFTKAPPRFGVGLGLVALVAVAIAASADGQLVRVPKDQPTIRAALVAATPGTTIVVAPGTYQENLVWPKVDGIRLVSASGPEQTVLDGGGRGRVVKFGPGLTRATRLEGFTLRNGFESLGGGIYVASSPTIMGNRILGCLGEDPVVNRGGGIYVAPGASPRIALNVILGNRLDKAQTSYGAGICVADTAYPELIGNHILNNVCAATGQGSGGGIHLGLTGTPSPMLMSNVVADNEARGVIESRGGGINVEGGTAILANNTLAGNACVALARSVGGGVHLGKAFAAGSRLENNIVVKNRVSAATQFGGGIYCEGPPPAIDFNDVWNNTGGDYFGCAPGLNDFGLDPRFLGPADYHLLATSPCVEGGSNRLVPAAATIDGEGDPRMLDGDLDGLRGNGARVDVGADEITGVRLSVNGQPAPGATSTFLVMGPAGGVYALAGSTTSGALFVDPFGTLLIGLPAALLGTGTTPALHPYPIPFNNALAGFEFKVQALVAQSQGGQVVGQLTNRLDLTLVKRFDRPLVESFNDREQLDPAGTTAAWTLGGQRGLHATVGFGGGGADGDVQVHGTLVLDSTTRQPGPDGVVEWNFMSLLVGGTGRVVLRGNRPIRINVLKDCLIDGIVDASGLNGMKAPPGKAANVGLVPGGRGGPGAGAGGDANTNPSHPIGALPMELRGGPGFPLVVTACGEANRSANLLVSPFTPNCGGGTGGNRGLPLGILLRSGCSGNGGGHAQDGVQTDYQCSNIQANGGEYGRLWIVQTSPNWVTTLTAGTGGGAGGNAAISTTTTLPSDDIVAGSGGGGGGGVELAAVGRLNIGWSGKVLADGGNGGLGFSTLISTVTIRGGYGGGGSGGSIWLSGTSVTVQAGGTLSALGGIGNPNPHAPTRTGNGGDGYVIVRDLTGNPSIAGALIRPAPMAGRQQFAPASLGKSTAHSRWYATGGPSPSWAFNANNPTTGEVVPGSDLSFIIPPQTNQKVFIDFQGAPDVNGLPDPNPANWYPPGNTQQNPNTAFEPDIRKLNGKTLRYVRFRIRFDLGPVKPPTMPVVVIDRIQINY